LGGLTVRLKKYTEAKVQKLIKAYLDSKVQAEISVEVTQETLPGVPDEVARRGRSISSDCDAVLQYLPAPHWPTLTAR
jgi:hypothetical protein